MSQFEDDYKDQRWIVVRLSIFERDGHRCRRCGSTESIQCHHTIYFKGRRSWEYDARYLLTLCCKCHKKGHEHLEIIKTALAQIEISDSWDLEVVSKALVRIAHSKQNSDVGAAFLKIYGGN